ncbi:hypothetical protein [Bdellovibrio sp. NC01]|uniref:hypothetical protein n=1 Tax=Bdellovibrio sp. NC01 TaxID=2220073 RepID=UPI00115B4855|nr:hypothetical protein [Bdellovibrio sp. NC01]QDK37492.1 hypothetical protein DOE51_07805 [Bdellovibrio sp. NC01]
MFSTSVKSLAVMVFLGMSVQSFAQEGTSTTSIWLNPKAKSYKELYSENSYYEQYNLVTDTRLRYYQPLYIENVLSLDAFAGAGFQYQSPNAQQKYFDNSVTPYVGMRAGAFQKIFLQFQAGVRAVLNDENSGQTNRSAEWDPRVILSAGDFWQWPVDSHIFTEGYGEVAYVPRLDSTPVSTGWLKQGYRFKPMVSVNIDPYAEFYLRESRSADLGPSMKEGRVGVRTQWLPGSWNLAALIYHPINRTEAHGDIEGLLVIGGQF